MPAHLRPILTPVCDKGICQRQATKTLYTERNEKIGDYCDGHAAEAIGRYRADHESSPSS